jgi:hypothetical protein
LVVQEDSIEIISSDTPAVDFDKLRLLRFDRTVLFGGETSKFVAVAARSR